MATFTTRRRRRAIIAAAFLLAGTLTVINGSAQAADGPFFVEGLVPDGPPNPGTTPSIHLIDDHDNTQELGPLNAATTKIGVIQNDAPPTLGTTNPNAQVDLSQAWIDVKREAGKDWVYFGWERDKSTGSGFIAYEFMQNPAPAACDYAGATQAQLIASCNPWANRDGDTDGSDNPATPAVEGGPDIGDFLILWDQQGGNRVLQLAIWQGTAPNLTLGAPTVLNAAVSQAEFSADGFRGEAAVNLTDTIFGGTATCLSFANTIPSTVTGNSNTADYKDTILTTVPPVTNCASQLVTTPKDGAGTDIPAAGISIGTDGVVAVKDSAALTITGVSTWTGTLAFSLCGPLAAGVTCATGGTAVSSGTVTNTTSQPIVSGTATVTSVGRYCWRGDFTPVTEGVPNATDASEGECFTVTPRTPTLTTTATPSVTIGASISDVGHLSGTADRPDDPIVYLTTPTTDGGHAGGTITFTAYGPNDATCSGTPAYTSDAIPVNGNGDYGSGSFAPTLAGTYRWTATYTGDTPNTNTASSACNADNETTVVNPKTPTIVTQASANIVPVPVGTAIHDTATIGNTAAPAGGTVTFRAYGPNDATCTTAVFTSADIPVTGDGSYGSGDFIPTLPGTYRWIATYTGNPPNTTGPVSTACADPLESSLVIQLQPTIATAQTFTVKDSATITVGAGAGNLVGSVQFRLYTTVDCSGAVLFNSGVIPVNGASPQVKESGTYTFLTPQPTLSWLVEYTSTNAGHTNVSSNCHVENASLAYTNG